MTKKLEEYSLEDVLNTIYEHISIVDKDGYFVFVNKAVERTGFTQSQLIGKHMRDCIKMGYMKESAVLKCLDSKQPEGMVHHDKSGDLFDWVTPHFDENGNLNFVICNEWDLSKLLSMQDFIQFSQTLPANELAELNYYRRQNSSQEKIVYKSDKMRKIMDVAEQAAISDVTILLLGETGVGKGSLMRYIHSKSLRNNAPLVEINCGAIPENLIESELFGYEKGSFTGAKAEGKKGLFELAHKGTLFLDEVGELPLNIQVKLLRAIQEKEITRIGGTAPIKVDVRIIAATNVNLEQAVLEKRFRADLYYRLNVMPINIPALRERTEDIRVLAEHFLEIFNRKYKKQITLSKSALLILNKYTWPGNIRELQNYLERIVLLSKTKFIEGNQLIQFFPLMTGIHINEEEQDSEESDSINLKIAMEQFERELLQNQLCHYKNLRQFSEFMQTEKSTIARKLKKYGLEPYKCSNNGTK